MGNPLLSLGQALIRNTGEVQILLEFQGLLDQIETHAGDAGYDRRFSPGGSDYVSLHRLRVANEKPSISLVLVDFTAVPNFQNDNG